MRKDLSARLSQLEQRCQLRTPVVLNCGWLANRLPEGYTGPYETVIVSRQPTASPNLFWCEFEERPLGCNAESDQPRGAGRQRA